MLVGCSKSIIKPVYYSENDTRVLLLKMSSHSLRKQVIRAFRTDSAKRSFFWGGVLFSLLLKMWVVGMLRRCSVGRWRRVNQDEGPYWLLICSSERPGSGYGCRKAFVCNVVKCLYAVYSHHANVRKSFRSFLVYSHSASLQTNIFTIFDSIALYQNLKVQFLNDYFIPAMLSVGISAHALISTLPQCVNLAMRQSGNQRMGTYSDA